MRRRVGVAFLVGIATVSAPRDTWAQASNARAPLTGFVVDQHNAALGGVAVVVRRLDTGVALAPVTTNDAGLFDIPGLDPGTYSVLFSKLGYKFVVVEEVRMVTATPLDLGRIVLAESTITETVVVRADGGMIQRQDTSVSATVAADQIATLPLATKNGLDFGVFLPGVDVGGTHVMRTSTTVSGLPRSAIAITVDGAFTQNPRAKSTDSYFSLIFPNIDAIEDVTLTSAVSPAWAAAQGAVQVRFVTRSGTNIYSGRFFETWRDPVMAANTFFNRVGGLPELQISLNQYGGNIGGPIVLPGYDGHGRAFFFVNLEQLLQPQENSRDRTILSAQAMSGVFSYGSGGITRQVDVLALAASQGQLATKDPMVAALLAQIAAATSSIGSLTPDIDGNTLAYRWNSPSELTRWFSTQRVDIQLTDAHRLSAIYSFNDYNRDPDALGSGDPRFPGFTSRLPNIAHRHSVTGILRSVLGTSTVSELSIGSFWNVTPLDPITADQFANQGGYTLALFGQGTSAFSGLAAATAGAMAATNANGNGNHPGRQTSLSFNASEMVTWIAGRHALQLGGELTNVRSWSESRQLVPFIRFGLDTADPADSLFKTANFPGASATNLSDARYLYALLTGRVSQITNTAALDVTSGQYVVNGFAQQQAHIGETGLFVQDSVRASEHVTLNFGARYEVQLPFRPDNSLWSTTTIADACGRSGLGEGPGDRPCSFFQPGTLAGVSPTFQQYETGQGAYRTDYRNIAPNAGVAWRPNVTTGILRRVLGDPELATIRVAAGRSFMREGLDSFINVFSANPGATRTLQRSKANGNLVLPGETWPVLLSEPGRLGPGDFPLTATFPMAADRTTSLNLFDPNWRMGTVDGYTAGLQRALSKDSAIEVRYVGTRGHRLLETENWNEVDLLSNGFADEFKRAQANLYANVAAGRGQTIAYAGPGTSPLPIYLAYFNGSGASSNPAAYTGANWTNTTFVSRFAALNPSPSASAGDLVGSATFRSNALLAGQPANLFQLNPDVSAVNVAVSQGFTRYDSLQIEFRRRLSHGLAADVNYTFGRRWESTLDSLHHDRYLVPSLAGVPHALKMLGSYDIPVGHDRRFGSTLRPWEDALAAGWTFSMTGRFTSGAMIDFGSVRLVGMTPHDLQQSLAYRTVKEDDGVTRVYLLPQDVIDNTIKAFSVNVLGYTAGAPEGRYFAPASGPDCLQLFSGDCAPRDNTMVAPPFSRFDISARKSIQVRGKSTLSIQIDVLNVFNAINFNPVGLPANPATATGYRVATSYQDVNDTADSGARTGQIVIRFHW